ncbi:MAG: response regulator [Oscillospiraceae bacterium]|nr:response regulator [Oscillospiraceae bacterium]
MQDLSNFRILIAEDDDINREIAVALIEETGVSIDCVENGEEALYAFADDPQKYNLILMDVLMPVMGGIEATKKIRAFDVPEAKQIPIIATTGNTEEDEIEECIKAGMSAHLSKPLDEEDFISTVASFLV